MNIYVKYCKKCKKAFDRGINYEICPECRFETNKKEEENAKRK